MLSVSFWHEADIEEARTGATPNVRFAAASLKGRLAAQGRDDAIAKYRAALPELCAKHGASIDDFRELSARYFAAGLSRRIAVTIEDRNGPRPEHEYLGIPVRRAKVMDRLGRIRTNRRGSSR